MANNAEFAVHFKLRKGLGPEWVDKTIFVGLDDVDPETTEFELKQMAINEAESQLYRTDDYKTYGKNWQYKDIERA